MRSWTICGAVIVMGAAVLGVSGLLAQSAGQDFDPSDPFARVKAADEWVKTVKTGAPDLDQNDRFRNLASEAWTAAWEGRRADQQNLASDAFLRTVSGSGGTGVRIRSP
jgi:hypothetical protein